ncbi:hypothetical protein ACFV9W_09745 [Streptomyces sp. NPDC059897]|uniref:hypothetical protein n=1 Tax=Streptomyces sp. NPDC059897 TaxID=3346994 RepID=UPI00366925A5
MYSYGSKNCRDYLGKDKDEDNDRNWSKKSNDKFSNGKSANNAISSHKWIRNSTGCSAYLS